jgi:hypothetical protein
MVPPMDQGQETAEPSASASSLPPPPALPDDGRGYPPMVRVPGQLSPVWRFAFGLAWAGIVACQAAVWDASRIIGLSTWWLGADAQPHFLLIQLLPFYGPLLVTVAAISNWRYAPYLGIAVAAVGAAIGAGDLGRVRWIALVELVIAGSAMCVSIASLAGMYRPVPASSVSGPPVHLETLD